MFGIVAPENPSRIPLGINRPRKAISESVVLIRMISSVQGTISVWGIS